MNNRKLFFLLAVAILLACTTCTGYFVDPGMLDQPGGGTGTGTGTGSGSGGGSGGVLTVTGIPSEYNGKWATAIINSGSNINVMGYQSVNTTTDTFTFTAVQIVNGSVSIPLYQDFNGNSRYTDSRTLPVVNFWIFGTSTFTLMTAEPIAQRPFNSIAFKNGSATIPW